ncbi:MAG: EF-hand domain-containing protein [Bacteroidota bacterium]
MSKKTYSENFFSEIHKKKIHHLFKVLDTDGSGVLSPVDFACVGEQIIAKSGLSKSERKSKVVLLKAHRLFIQLLTDIENPELTIELWEWVSFFKNQIESADREILDHYIQRTSRHIFDLFDSDRDGFIDHDEYIDMLSAYRISAHIATESFQELDSNDDNRISKEEMINGLNNFFLSDDEKAKGNLIFGGWK